MPTISLFNTSMLDTSFLDHPLHTITHQPTASSFTNPMHSFTSPLPPQVPKSFPAPRGTRAAPISALDTRAPHPAAAAQEGGGTDQGADARVQEPQGAEDHGRVARQQACHAAMR